jgi:secondary thiamine-phosphate synthase enzyme
MFQTVLTFKTNGRELREITSAVNAAIKAHASANGLCHLFIQHTSASIILCENADPDVKHDVENYMSRLVIDGDPYFKHRDEGDDDMSAHLRTILTNVSLTIPVMQHQLALGTWQGLYLWEHRYHQFDRKLIVTVY